MVVYNADAPGAKEVADKYATARSLPSKHVCALSGIDPKATSIPVATYLDKVQKPLDACIAAVGSPDEIDVLVTVRGLPYLVGLSAGNVGFEALLQVMHGTKDDKQFPTLPQTDSASIPNPIFIKGGLTADFSFTNPYQDWYKSTSQVVKQKVAPTSFTRLGVVDKGITYKVSKQLMVVARLDGFDLKDAADLIDRALASETGTPPTGTLLCMHGADEARGARDPECELAVRRLKGAGFDATWLPTFDGALKGKTLSAYLTGADSMRDAIAGNTYVPGAIVDNLTSFGAVPQNFLCSADGKTCPASESQTSIARFVRAGASFVHGTVAEPKNNVFPNAGALLHYTMGYAAGEAFLFHQQFLGWYNLHLGDPLMTPWAVRPKVTLGAAHAATPFTIKATHPNGVARVKLYVAGKREAEVAGDTLDAVLPGREGDKVEVLAVAVAKDVIEKRAGWAAAEVESHAAVQGWTAATVTLGTEVIRDTGPYNPIDDAGPGDTGPAADAPTAEDSGCGCRVGSTEAASGAGGLFLVGAALVGARRRRAPRASG